MNGKLTPDQVEIFKLWIDQGAQWEVESATASEARNWWAFKKPVRPAVPVTSEERMNRHPVDAFLMKAMQSQV